jgi:anti-sigma B factor antagonist
MADPLVSMAVRRVDPAVAIVDITGDVTAAAEQPLTAAFNEASAGATRAVALNFGGLDYMNGGGIGLLVTLRVRANRQRQRLSVFGLNDHYRQIFSLTRLDEAIGLYDNEDEAVAALAVAR